jgi:hypothetical protein
MSAAYHEALRLAATFRRSGYPEAEAQQAYCINGEIGMDNMYTYTVCVYMGKYDETAIIPFYKKLLDAVRK